MQIIAKQVKEEPKLFRKDTAGSQIWQVLWSREPRVLLCARI